MPKLAKGDVVDASFEIGEKTTTPPKRFTEGSLIAAMTNIWRFVSDKETKEMLKECKGLGTPATRDKIISELMMMGKNQKEPYMKKVKNELVPTDLGCALVDNVSEHLTSPEFTAIMEYNLGQIAEGKMSMQEYMDELLEDVMDCISHAEDPNSYKTFVSNGGVLCPECEKTFLKRVFIKSRNIYAWICPDKECLNSEGKKVFYDDRDGQPVILEKFDCTCGHPLKRVRKKDGNYAWVCPSNDGGCGKWYDDDDEKPLFLKEYTCPSCKHTLRRVHKKDGNYAWVCSSNDGGCGKWYDDVKAARTEFRNSVPSYRWSYEAIHVTEQILAPGAPERIACPVILFSAETDFSVEREPQQAFIGRVRNGQFVSVPGSRHEIYRSVNDVLFPWWNQVITFLKANCHHS